MFKRGRGKKGEGRKEGDGERLKKGGKDERWQGGGKNRRKLKGGVKDRQKWSVEERKEGRHVNGKRRR